MKYADTIRAAGLEVEPLMAWFIPWIGWSQPDTFDRFLEGVRKRDFRLRGAKQLRVFNSTHSLEFIDAGGKSDRIVVETRRDVAILRIVPSQDPGRIVQPDKIGFMVAVDTWKDVLIESRVLCERTSKDQTVSGDNIVAYVFPDHRDPLLIMGIDPPRVGRQFGWDIKKGETVIVERFQTIGNFSIPFMMKRHPGTMDLIPFSGGESGTITVDGQRFDVSNVRYEP